MKTNIFTTCIVLLFCFVVSSCGSNSSESTKAYWEIDDNFVAPTDWVQEDYADAFSFKIPPYMGLPFGDEHKLTKAPLKSGEWGEVSFNSARKDKLHDNYAYIDVRYIKATELKFNKYNDILRLSDPAVEQFCDQLLTQQLGTGKLLEVKDKTTLILSDGTSAIDICYSREGHTDDEGPVTVHIFFIQNYEEAVQLTISYHEKNKDSYKDLFNVVETFHWKNIIHNF